MLLYGSFLFSECMCVHICFQNLALGKTLADLRCRIVGQWFQVEHFTLYKNLLD